ALLECYELEHAVLTKATPEIPVTTNFMGFFKPLDYWKWARSEDIVSNDSYPDPSDDRSGMRAAMAGDLMRSLGHGKPWILMEQLEAYYEPLWEKNVLVDFAHPEDDLSTYRLVLVPNLYLVTDAAAANLEHFVASGGTLAMSFFSGIVDPSEHIRLGGYPQP